MRAANSTSDICENTLNAGHLLAYANHKQTHVGSSYKPAEREKRTRQTRLSWMLSSVWHLQLLASNFPAEFRAGSPSISRPDRRCSLVACKLLPTREFEHLGCYPELERAILQDLPGQRAEMEQQRTVCACCALNNVALCNTKHKPTSARTARYLDSSAFHAPPGCRGKVKCKGLRVIQNCWQQQML